MAEAAKAPNIRRRTKGGDRTLEPSIPEEVQPLVNNSRGFKLDSDETPKLAERVHIPPLTETDRTLRDEQQVARVEQLMIRGFRDPSQLCAMLGIEDRRQMDRYIRRVHARWDITGSKNDLRRYRGEALAKIQEIQRQYWVLLQNCPDDDVRAKAVIVASLKSAQEYEAFLKGLTAKQIEKMNLTTEDSDVVMRMQKQTAIAGVAQRMAQLFRDRMQSLDGPGQTIMDREEPDPFDYQG